MTASHHLPTVAIVGTLDTKSSEIMFLKDFITSKGFNTTVIDVSMLEHKYGAIAGTTSSEIARAAGSDIKEVSSSKDRNFGTIVMGRGLTKVLLEALDAGKIDGTISVGGAQGTSIASTALRELPIGFPKVLVSAVASGNVRPFVGARDIAMMFSVADINGGLNPVTRTVLSNAAGAVMGMIRDGQRLELGDEKRLVGITSWGTTQRAVTAATLELRKLDYDPVIFHSSGACTSAMESLVEQGFVSSVLDLTTHDFLGEVFSQELMPPVTPGRLGNAGKRGIPLIVAPGGLNMFVMGPYATLEAEYKQRPTIAHNPAFTEVRLTREELMTVAERMAERLNAAQGYCAFLAPKLGWNDYDAQGSPMYGPEDDAAFVRRLRELTERKVEFYDFDGNLNEAGFGHLAVQVLKKHLS